MSLKLYFRQSSKKPQIGLVAAFSGVDKGGRLYFRAAVQGTETPIIKACGCAVGLGRLGGNWKEMDCVGRREGKKMWVLYRGFPDVRMNGDEGIIRV